MNFKESELAREKLDIEASTIVVVYNQSLSLKLVLKSLLSQTFRGHQEIIIADDGSNLRLFSNLKSDFDKAGIPIKYIWQQKRGVRLAESRNNGIKIAKGKYLLLLDGDMVPNLRWVSQHLDSHTKSRLIVAGSRSWRGTINTPLFKTLGEQPIEDVLGHLEQSWPVDENSKNREITERNRRLNWLHSPHPWRACFGGNLSIQREPEVLFDEKYTGWGYEDWEFAYRLCKQHGYTTLYSDAISAHHLETPQSIINVFRTGGHEEIVRYIRNTFTFFITCPGLELEDVFFGFPRFALNTKTNHWSIIPRPTNYNRELLKEKIGQVKRWLEEN